ncbi:MAG: SHOCT domain-containing protein [Sedimenticola sp.]
MKTNLIIAAFSVAILSGCAGSANHKVLSAHEAEDTTLTCDKIDNEIIKAQVVIDGVNKDKDDLSGADVVDGILWFPFNLIAKSQNYDSAINAADRRIDNLQKLQNGNGCVVASKETHKANALKLSGELDKLNQLYKEGALTDDEYKTAKKKVLDGFSG